VEGKIGRSRSGRIVGQGGGRVRIEEIRNPPNFSTSSRFQTNLVRIIFVGVYSSRIQPSDRRPSNSKPTFLLLLVSTLSLTLQRPSSSNNHQFFILQRSSSSSHHRPRISILLPSRIPQTLLLHLLPGSSSPNPSSSSSIPLRLEHYSLLGLSRIPLPRSILSILSRIRSRRRIPPLKAARRENPLCHFLTSSSSVPNSTSSS